MKRTFSRAISFSVGVAVLAALVLPLGSVAVAHVDGEHELQVTPEVSSNPTGTAHTLTATLGAPAPAGGEEIDFEIESGPSFRTGCTVQPGDTCTGGTEGSSTNTPTSPDLTCTVPQGQTSCQVVFTSDSSGTHQIRAWVDDDKNNATIDFDVTEGRNAGSSDCPGPDCTGSGAVPGDRTEPDDTDVVSKTWFGELAAAAVLDCSPEVATNPASGDGSAETYTCQLYDSKGTSATSDDTVLTTAGVRIDGENLGGANDPDDSLGAGTADYNDACTTGSGGSCTVTIAASEAQAGDALICFWTDTDADNVFSPTGTENDGGSCDEADELTGSGSASATTIGSAERDDRTDVVRKTWVARGVATDIDCSPETDQNVRGTNHTVTCTVTDAFGDPVQGAAVDFDVAGRNTAAQNNSTTDRLGQVSFTYPDSNAALTTEGQTDTIRGCVDPDATAGCATVTDPDMVDGLQKFWFTTLPVAASVVLDMRNLGGGDNCEKTGGAAESTATNPVSSTAGHLMCATVFDAQGNPVPGEEVTFTISGVGNFFDDRDQDGTRDAGESDLTGTTFTTTTDATGEARASIISTRTGTTEVTAEADGQSDSGTKTWTIAPSQGRNIACTPVTASNPPGTSHVVACTVTDRFGNPVPSVEVDFTESGPGRITSEDDVTGSDGVAEVIVASATSENGDQSITAVIEVGSGAGFARGTQGGSDDPCDQPAGSTSAAEGGPATGQDPAPVGNCTITVTKTWAGAVPQQPACNDGVDNDGDGLIDFPNDPGCESAQDDDETNEPPVQETGPCQGFRQGETHVGAAGTGDIVVGTPGNDILVGSDGDDIICGLGGDDVIRALGGDDQVVGNAGNDTIQGNGGKDEINGNRDDDTIDGNRKNDIIRGSKGDDTLRGNRGWDTVRGGSGNDTLQGGRGNDILRGGGGNDTLKGFDGDDILNGGTGTDVCVPGRGNDVLRNCER